MENKLDSKKLAYYIINSKKYPNISHLKLQKLLYYVQSWHIVFFEGNTLFNDEFEAWVHGPVSKKIYNNFKEESKLHRELSVNTTIDTDLTKELNAEQIELIDDVLNEYGDKSPYHLECLTHDEKPWIEARGHCKTNEICMNVIDNKTIKSYYESLIA